MRSTFLLWVISAVLSPCVSLAVKSDAVCDATNAEERFKKLKLIAKMEPVAGEFRLITCHKPWGKTADWNWDSRIQMLKACGFTHLSVNVCRGIYAAYDSKVLKPWPGMVSHGDALELLKVICVKHGIKLSAWRCCWQTPTWLIEKNDLEQLRREGLLAVDSKGNEITKSVCPSNPKNINREIDCLMELSSKGISAIDMDYIRYPDEDSCYCVHCRQMFEKRLGKNVDNWPDATKNVPEVKCEWQRFKMDNITRIVRAVGEHVHLMHPEVGVRIYGFQNPVIACETVGQDWPNWCRHGWIDEVLMMDYRDSVERMCRIVNWQRQLDVGCAKLRPLIGPSCWENVGDDEWRTASLIQCVRECGYDGWGIFDLDDRVEKICQALSMGPTRAHDMGFRSNTIWQVGR